MMRATVVVGLVACGVAACHQKPRANVAGSAEPIATVTDTTVRGIVRVLGPDPRPQVVLRSGSAGADIGIVGPLRAEIGSLDGVEISATGPVVPNQPPPPRHAVEARSYATIAVSGMPAYSGVLVRRGESLWLIGARDTVQLADPVPSGVTEALGATVFVAGPMVGERLRVQAFGVIKKR